MRRRVPGFCEGQPGTTGVEAWGMRTSMERREESGRVELTDALMDRGRLGSERLAAQAFSGAVVSAGDQPAPVEGLDTCSDLFFRGL